MGMDRGKGGRKSGFGKQPSHYAEQWQDEHRQNPEYACCLVEAVFAEDIEDAPDNRSENEQRGQAA
jgi:hypothetical protein